MVRFDDAAGQALRELERRFPDKLPQTTLIRDPSGRVTLVLPDDALGTDEWDRMASTLHDALERYSPGVSQVLLRQSDLIDAVDILESPDRVVLPEVPEVALVDRMLTNQDWIRAPLLTQAPVPTATFFSIKGGVGRTTALCVLAWHLAILGKRVLVADLDLEAPGLGPTLLSELPEFGLVDWCVEALAGQADADLFERMLAPARLAEHTPGNILVVPAFGTRTRDYVSKLGRAYMPEADADGVLRGVADRLRLFLDQAAKRIEPPEVVLLDARAGLSDIGSAAVTQLGAEVFLFSRDDPQSWNSYGRLFEHLRRARGVQWGMPDKDLRWRLKMVAAQLEPTEASVAAWLDRSYSTWSNFYDSEETKEQGGANVFEREDEAAPHFPLRVAFDPRVRAIDWVNPAMRPDAASLMPTFENFLSGATMRMLPRDAAAGASP